MYVRFWCCYKVNSTSRRLGCVRRFFSFGACVCVFTFATSSSFGVRARARLFINELLLPIVVLHCDTQNARSKSAIYSAHVYMFRVFSFVIRFWIHAKAHTQKRLPIILLLLQLLYNCYIHTKLHTHIFLSMWWQSSFLHLGARARTQIYVLIHNLNIKCATHTQRLYNSLKHFFLFASQFRLQDCFYFLCMYTPWAHITRKFGSMPERAYMHQFELVDFLFIYIHMAMLIYKIY